MSVCTVVVFSASVVGTNSVEFAPVIVVTLSTGDIVVLDVVVDEESVVVGVAVGTVPASSSVDDGLTLAPIIPIVFFFFQKKLNTSNQQSKKSYSPSIPMSFAIPLNSPPKMVPLSSMTCRLVASDL